MPWWRKQDWAASERSRRGRIPSRAGATAEQVNTGVRVSVPAQPSRRSASTTAPITTDRVAESLRRLGIRHLSDEQGQLLGMWERHVVLFGLEGPDDEILVMRARAHAGVPKDWADRAYTAVNEWNHTRRFLKSYVGDETESGLLSLYAEMQIPLVPGVHDALLDELVDCAAAVSGSWVAWLYDEGAVL